MKLIEALKKVKDLLRKADDLSSKISKHSADLDCETPVYQDQKEQVRSWLQAHSDVLKEICYLQYCILKTNVLTKVTVEIDGKHIEKSITEWMTRRKTLAKKEADAWNSLTDRNLREGNINQSNGAMVTVKIRRYYDPKERDHKVSVFSSEPSLIDAKLEIANCVTDLIE